MERLVIIGAGMAAGRLIDHLVTEAPERFAITLFNAEPIGSYNRIQLSPVLAGEMDFDAIVTHDAAFYAAHAITCRFGERVTAIDRTAKQVIGENGAVAYDRLVIATGSSPVILPLPGHDLDGVIAWRSYADTQAMIGAAQTGGRAVVIGGGLLGLEAAAGLKARGFDVTVVHLMDHLMERQLDAEAGALLRRTLMARGIHVLCGAQSAEIAGQGGRVRALRLTDGTELPCEVLVMAVGIRPATALAAQAGLATARGVLVDDGLATDDPAIFALGECTEHDGQVFGLVAPLFDQARVLADRLQGQPARFVAREVSTRLKVTGCDLFSAGDFATGADREEVILRDPARGIYKRLVIAEDRLIGAVLYGDVRDGGWFQSLIDAATPLGALRETMIFGPAYEAAIAAGPYGGLCSLTA